MQYAMRHADPRTTLRYDMAKTNLERHAAHADAAYLAGVSTGRPDRDQVQRTVAGTYRASLDARSCR